MKLGGYANHVARIDLSRGDVQYEEYRKNGRVSILAPVAWESATCWKTGQKLIP